MKIAHLTTVDLSLRYLLLPQLEAAMGWGESIGISAPGEHVAEIEELGVRHVPLASSTRGMSLTADLRAMRELWKVLKAERLDILHTHNPKPGVYGRILGRLAGVPVVVNTVHGLYAVPDDSLPKRAIVYGLEALASRFSDAELIQNPEDLDLLKRLRIVSPAKLHLLGNGVDLERFNPTRAEELRGEARGRLGLSPDEIAVGMVGRLVAEKGVPELVEAAVLMESDARIFVAGPHDPDKPDAIEEELLARGRERGVEFLGMRPDVDAFYAALDIFVLPSHREGFPRSAMEAAAMGLPLVLTDIRGCRQVVDDGVNGLLVPVGEPGHIANAIDTLATDAAWRSRMSRASAQRAIQNFDENRVVEIVMGCYRSVLESRGLAWKRPSSQFQHSLRDGVATDSKSIAKLHHEGIGTGFLSSLGPGFLEVLYRTMIDSVRASVIVVESDGAVVGFVAGTVDTGAFYRDFFRRKVLTAAFRTLPSLLRPSTWRNLWETTRYGGESLGASVSAELLSMAVAPEARRSGVGAELVESLQGWYEQKGVDSAKVVVGADNAPAISLYSRCGFEEPRELEVHRGVRSIEMIWRA